MKSSGSHVKSRNKVGRIDAAEVPLLFALATIPSLFVLGLDAPFEPPKAVVLYVTASLVLPIAVWGGRLHLRALALHRPLIRPFVVACLCAAGALALSVWWSDAPALGWWGSGLRRFGGASELALLAVTLATALLISDPRRLDRACAAVAIGSIVPTLVALAQWTGFDPFDAHGPRGARPGSTFGNPLFLAGYLVTAMPLTVARAIRAGRRRIRGAWWMLVALQAIAFVAARSIGPMVALLAATLMAAAILLAGQRRRIPAIAIASVLALAAMAALVAGPRLMRDGPLTVRFRVLVWQAAGAAIGAEPGRMIFGSGPESMTRSLIRYADASITKIEGQTVVPDRAHNQTLDTMLAFGVIGLAARLTIEYLALAAAFIIFGVLLSSERRRFVAFAAIINVCAIGGAWVFFGAWTLAMSVPMAFVLVASLWIVRSAGRPVLSPSRDWTALVMGATVAWLAHDFEVQTGIATISSALIAAVALGGILGAAAAPPKAVADRPRGWIGVTIAAAIAGVAVFFPIVDGMAATDDLALASEAAALARQADAAVGSRRDELMRAATRTLERARIVNPYNYHYARTRASLERRWARKLPPAERPPHLMEADRSYAAALDLAPMLPFLWEEWANLAIERGMPAEGLQRLERLLELGAPPVEVFELGDAALGATGVDVAGPGGIEKSVEVLRSRGHPRLAQLYAGRPR